MPNATEISAAQLAANQQNAQKSTGPRTEEGKAKARFNARRHGLTGQFYCMSEQDEDAYRTFEADMLQTLNPVGAYENQIAISIVQDHWRLNRSRATEFNLYGRGHDERADLTDAPTENSHAAATMADTARDDHRVFANIALYETRIHRMIVKNENRLEELQSRRKAAEKIARDEAELLLRFDDLAGEEHDACESLTVNGFVFSRLEILAKMRYDQRLSNAKTCAAYAWDPRNPSVKPFVKVPKAA